MKNLVISNTNDISSATYITIHSIDESVGNILDYLDDTGLAENTLVIYTSDQGFFLGEHGWYDKRFMYEESFQMPFLARYLKFLWGQFVKMYAVMSILHRHFLISPVFPSQVTCKGTVFGQYYVTLRVVWEWLIIVIGCIVTLIIMHTLTTEFVINATN